MRVNLVQADAALALATEAAEGPVDPDRAAAAVTVARITTAAVATELAPGTPTARRDGHHQEKYPLHRYTRRLWAWRDAVASERTWSDQLGRRTAALGEETAWMELTSSGW
jgi:acyl-CoA dehydrogenase